MAIKIMWGKNSFVSLVYAKTNRPDSCDFASRSDYFSAGPKIFSRICGEVLQFGRLSRDFQNLPLSFWVGSLLCWRCFLYADRHCSYSMALCKFPKIAF